MTDPLRAPQSAPLDRRALLGGAALALSCSAAGAQAEGNPRPVERPAARAGRPLLVGSANALAGMQRFYPDLQAGADPLDVAIQIVKVQEADPLDDSVGLGGLPNEDGVVQLDAACMYGPTHKSGAVACIENILHPSEVARLVLERTDHCLLVGEGAYRFARAHGHAHTELLTEASRQKWMEWKEGHSSEDDRLLPPERRRVPKTSQTAVLAERSVARARDHWKRPTGTVHCSALSATGLIACTTTTSGLAYKIPGRVGDSPIVGAGLYCDQEVGSAGSTGRGEASILSNGSFALVELMRQGASPRDAGVEVLRRIVRQVQRLAVWQPELVDAQGLPVFGLHFYALDASGRFASVSLAPGNFAVADSESGPRHVESEVVRL